MATTQEVSGITPLPELTPEQLAKLAESLALAKETDKIALANLERSVLLTKQRETEVEELRKANELILIEARRKEALDLEEKRRANDLALEQTRKETELALEQKRVENALEIARAQKEAAEISSRSAVEVAALNKKTEALRTARDILIENARSKPVNDRQVTDEDIVTLAKKLLDNI